MFSVVGARAFTASSKFSKFQNSKTSFKAQNAFSVHKFNNTTFQVEFKQIRIFSTDDEKRPPPRDPRKLLNKDQPEKSEEEEDVRDKHMKRMQQLRHDEIDVSEVTYQFFEDAKNDFRKAQFEYQQGIKKERRKKSKGEEDEVTEKLKRRKEASEKISSSTEKLLMGDYKVPDPWVERRSPDGKLLDDKGNEIPVNERTGFPMPINPMKEFEEEGLKTGLSAVAKRRMLKLDDERHERNIRELRLRALQVSTAMGMQGAKYRLDSLPVEELKKVWNYVRRPNPERPISTVVFNYQAGEIDDSYYKTGDPLITYFRKTHFFRKHPEKKYLYWAGIFLIGVAVAIAIAILDAFTLDHTGQEDKNKTYFRARLISTMGYTAAGAGATLGFTRLFASTFLKARRLDLLAASFAALPLYTLFYVYGTTLNYPEDHAIGKLAVATALAASVGLGVATHSLKKGTGFVRLLVPVLFSTTALSASLAISPFNFNLEYGVPLAVLSATFAGMFGASAVFPPYRSNTRAVIGSMFALTYAGLLLSYTQPYLNRIKFQERYYGVDTYARDTNLLMKTFFFVPLKALDIVADQSSKRDLFQKS